MRVGILGTGDVGKALGKGFITLGDEVKMGSPTRSTLAGECRQSWPSAETIRQGKHVQRLLPDAHVVKAFNTVGNPFMFRPDFPGDRRDADEQLEPGIQAVEK